MTDEYKFFLFLLECYAAHKGVPTGDVLKAWDRQGVTQEIYDNYCVYHTERLENAYADIDALLTTGKHLY